MRDRKGTAMHALSTKVLNTIRSHGMIEPGGRIIAGVSGGPDSVCLLRILHGLAGELQYGELCAAHVNHGLRGAESDGDEQFVRELAEELGIPFESMRCDVAGLAAAEGMGTESAARQARYEALEQCRQRRGAQWIAVAHNRNDQAETILMRILRGTGIHGLRGMEYNTRGGILIRPLLDADRQEIEACCKEQGWAYRTDGTNAQTIYTRNRVRLDLLPKLEAEYNPKMQEALLRLGRQAAETDAALDAAAERYISGAADGSGGARWSESAYSLSMDGFAALPPAVGKRVLQRCLDRQAPGTDLSAVMLEQMYQTALGPEPAEADAGRGRYVRRMYGSLWFLRRPSENRSEEQPAFVPVQALEETGLQILQFGGRDIVLKIINVNRGGTGDARGLAIMDWDKIRETDFPVFRHRRPGDRIRPLGMRGSKKLQDFLVDRKIPRHQRDTLLLLAAGQRILLAGSEPAADCAVTKETERILVINY